MLLIKSFKILTRGISSPMYFYYSSVHYGLSMYLSAEWHNYCILLRLINAFDECWITIARQNLRMHIVATKTCRIPFPSLGGIFPFYDILLICNLRIIL